MYSSAPPWEYNVKIAIEIRSESDPNPKRFPQPQEKSKILLTDGTTWVENLDVLANQGYLCWTNPTNQSGEYSAAGLLRLSAAAEAWELRNWEVDFNQSCSLKILFGQS